MKFDSERVNQHSYLYLSFPEVKVATSPLTTGSHEVVFEVVDPCELTGTGTLTIVVLDNVSRQHCRLFHVFCLFCLGFTPFSTLFKLYHGDSSLINDPCVHNPVQG